ncbi:hypothetical protein ACTOWA_20780 [Herbaspirillum seropedicae]|uniref:hypothetical protein n=1 Tax=Herbaspirillum seropedicae TaxID=964 RepID=UPI003F8D7C27
MPDLERKNVTQPGFSQISAKLHLIAVRRRRDVTDVLRTIFWCEGLLLRTERKTAYHLAKKFDPHTFGMKDGVRYGSSKWQKYVLGKHTPSSGKIASVELAYAGSAQEINHVLWKSLHSKFRCTPQNIRRLLEQLAPCVQSVVFRTTDTEGERVRSQINTTRLDVIAQKCSLDSLACLTILLREAAYLREERLAFEISLRVYQVLLMLAAAFQGRKIADSLVQLYSERIFTLVVWQGYVFYIETEKFIESSLLLNELAAPEENGQIVSWELRVKKMFRILEGRYGLHFCFALHPLYAPVPNAKNQKEVSQFRKRVHLYTQAWRLIYSKADARESS